MVVSAPGKLILMGEHAAVYGHPALVAAVDLRLTVTLAATTSEAVELDLPQLDHRGTTPWEAIRQLTLQARRTWENRFSDPRSNPIAASGDPALQARLGVTPAQLVLLTLGETSNSLGEDFPKGVRLRVDSALPVGSGFGSSAALAVGVAAAYLALRGVALEPSRILDISLDVERRQHGTPSGIDNAAVLLGGLLWAERDAANRLECRPLESSSPLLDRVRVFHSGAPSESTGEVVEAVRRRRERDTTGVDQLLEEIESCTRELRQDLETSTLPERTVSLIRRCQGALEGLGVVPTPTQQLIRRIEAEGGAAKISGAGSLTGEGAGSILVYHPEVSNIDRWSFLRSWTPLPVRFPAPGLLVQST
ncbi:MAG: hypothetical protein K8J08_03345 [Thermoanaerobaculia bacterium]|nr:hypothetical protein [Thermoanaerobaculia bacterium]